MSERPELNSDRVEELLADWELSRLEGKELTPEDLARDCPELLAEIRAGVAALQSTSWVLEVVEDGPTASYEVDPEETLPESSLTVEEFIAAVEDSGVLSRRGTSILVDHRKHSKAPETAHDFAAKLVERGALTHYQARTLLSGRDDPLLLDRYIILDVIGAGGMGLVFKALHRSMDRVVALKILPPGSIESAAKAERFRREIKAVAKLSH
ncbi:MAG: hypothetical protein AAF961_12985, partial [Planctomycetota bacterium]